MMLLVIEFKKHHKTKSDFVCEIQNFLETNLLNMLETNKICAMTAS